MPQDNRELITPFPEKMIAFTQAGPKAFPNDLKYLITRIMIGNKPDFLFGFFTLNGFTLPDPTKDRLAFGKELRRHKIQLQSTGFV